MPLDAIETTELLGAYLNGDITSGERAAVERLLRDNIVAREQLEELQDLTVFLKEGDIQATPPALMALRETVQNHIKVRHAQALTAAAITGDLTPGEKLEVETYLNSHPEAVAAQREFAAAAQLLNAGKNNATDALANTLRLKMQAALPAAALASKAAVPLTTLTPNMSAHEAGLPQRAALRVFVKAENPWRRRVAALSGLAALFALTLSARALWNRTVGTAHQDSKNIVQKDNSTHPDQQGDEKAASHVLSEGANESAMTVEPRDATQKNTVRENNQNCPVVPPKPPLAQAEPEKTPLPAPQEIAVPREIVDTVNDVIKRDAVVPKKNESVVKGEAPSSDSNPTAKPDTTTSKNPYASIPVPRAQNSSGANGVADNVIGNNGIGNTSVGNSVAVGTGNSAPNTVVGSGNTAPAPSGLAPTSIGTTITPHDGVGVAGVIKGGGVVQITSPNGTVTPLKNSGDTVQSGSTIETSDARVSLVLPGNGRLYVNHFSKVTVTFGKNTVIALSAGEVYYIVPPAGGNLTVTNNKAVASEIQEADLKLTAGKLTVLNTSDSPLRLSARKNTLPVRAGVEASVATDGTERAKADPTVTLSGFWRVEVNIAGDGIKAPRTHK